MKRFIFSILAGFIFTKNLAAQGAANNDTIKPLNNSWYVEFGGTALLGASFNYERFLSKNPGGISLRAGLGGGYVPGIFESGSFYGAVPAGISYNIPIDQNKRSFIELGGNYAFILSKEFGSQFTAAVAGWRYQNASGKLQFRATLFPVLYSFKDHETAGIPWFGFSVGSRF